MYREHLALWSLARLFFNFTKCKSENVGIDKSVFRDIYLVCSLVLINVTYVTKNDTAKCCGHCNHKSCTRTVLIKHKAIIPERKGFLISLQFCKIDCPSFQLKN